MKEILVPLNFTTTPTLYDTKQSFSTSDEASGVLIFTTTADVSGTVASLTIRNASENANRQTVIVERLDVNSSPFSYAVKMPLPFGSYEGALLLKKNLTVIASATFLFGVNSSLSAEVLPKLVEAYSLDELVETVETEVSVLKDAYSLTVSETVKGVNKTESTLQLSENVRYLNEATRKANELLRISQEAARVAAEEGRVTEFGALVDSAVIEQTVTQEVAEQYQLIESTQANRLLSAEQQLADIEKVTNVVDVTKFGATPNSLEDQTPYIQNAVDHLKTIGGGTLFFPAGEYRIIANENTTTSPTYNPKRVLISGHITGEEIFNEDGTVASDTRKINYVENIHIRGHKDAVIYMTGMTEEFLYQQDDIEMGNVDIFTAFTFRYARFCSVADIKIKGDYLTQGIPFRYSSGVSQARTKAISFFGSSDCSVFNVDARYIMGNFVHVNTASRVLDGYWHPSEGISIYNNHFDTCLEIGVNLTTIAPRCRVADNTLLRCNGAGIEGPAIIKGNTIKDGKGGGISPSADAIVTDNVIENIGKSAFILTANASMANAQRINTIISNNYVKNVKKHFLHIYPNSGNLICSNNRFINSNMENDTNNAYDIMVYLAGNSSQEIKNVSITNNYFEISDINSFTEYVFYVVGSVGAYITDNRVNTVKELISDIYMSDLNDCFIQDNHLSKGIQQSSTNKNRNIILNNYFPASNFPVTSNWSSATPPDLGNWKVGDFLKKNPTVFNFTNGTSRIELGWYCTSTSPLTWKLVSIDTGKTDTSLTSNKGTKFANGDGTNKVFTIAHGLGNMPSYFNVQKSAIGLPIIDAVTADATNLTVTFITAPVSGTSNISLKWKVEI